MRKTAAARGFERNKDAKDHAAVAVLEKNEGATLVSRNARHFDQIGHLDLLSY